MARRDSPSRVENLDGDEIRLLRNTVACASSDAGDVRPVTVVVVLTKTGPSPAKLGTGTEIGLV